MLALKSTASQLRATCDRYIFCPFLVLFSNELCETFAFLVFFERVRPSRPSSIARRKFARAIQLLGPLRRRKHDLHDGFESQLRVDSAGETPAKFLRRVACYVFRRFSLFFYRP